MTFSGSNTTTLDANEISNLIDRVNVLRKEQDILLQNSNVDDYSGYLKTTKSIREEIDNIVFLIELNTPVHFERIPSFSDKMELETFIDFSNNDIYTDIEGVGYYSDGYRMTDKSIYPSDVKSGRIRSDFKYVVWLEVPIID